MFRYALILVLVFMSMSSMAHAQTQPSRTDLLSHVFMKLCLLHHGNSELLQANLAPGQPMALPRLKPDGEKAFLAGQSGAAWRLPAFLGEAVLALKEDGSCTIFVREWEEQAINEKLLQDVETALGNLYRAEEVERHDSDLSTVVYAFYPSGDLLSTLEERNLSTEPEMHLVVSTSTVENVNFQLAVTLGGLP